MTLSSKRYEEISKEAYSVITKYIPSYPLNCLELLNKNNIITKPYSKCKKEHIDYILEIVNKDGFTHTIDNNCYVSLMILCLKEESGGL